MIDLGESGIVNKSITSPEGYQAAVLKQANKTHEQFKKLSKYGWYWIPSFVSSLSLIAGHTADLLSTAAPLTKQAYLDAAAKFEDIKHRVFPRLLAEIEGFEESMGLKPGTLTDPVIKQMNAYYTKFANYANHVATAALHINNTAWNAR